jgi:hypothetical protein
MWLCLKGIAQIPEVACALLFPGRMFRRSLDRIRAVIVVSFFLVATPSWAIPAGLILTFPQDIWHFRCGNFIDISQVFDVESLLLGTERRYFAPAKSLNDGEIMTFEKSRNRDPYVVVTSDGAPRLHHFSELTLLPRHSKIWTTKSEGAIAKGQSLVGAYVRNSGVLMTADGNWISLCRLEADPKFRSVRSFLSRLSVPLNEIVFELRSCQTLLVSKTSH